jgi:hypothetical protein
MINIDFRKYWGKIIRTLASKSRNNLNIKPLLVGLRKRIYDRQDIILFDEVVRCIKVRAYRMAYIAIWINIAESLKNKFKIISQKDKVVDKIVQEIAGMENKHTPPDKYILEKAKDLGMLDEVVYAKLVNILTMRNLYAHPYQQEPSGLDVISALTISVDNVLSAPPLLLKRYIDNLVDTLQTNRHFIDDLKEKVEKFASDIVHRIAPNLHPYFIKSLFYHFNMVIDDPDMQLFTTRFMWFTRTCIREIKPNFAEQEWQLHDKFIDFPKVISTIFITPDLWDILQDNIQDSIVSYLLFPEIEN